MARPIYPYELGDPDFSWLISSFLESNPEYSSIENGCLPVVFLKDVKTNTSAEEGGPDVPHELLPQSEETVLDDQEY